MQALAVRCRECDAIGPHSLSDDPAHAVFSWNQRMGRLEHREVIGDATLPVRICRDPRPMSALVANVLTSTCVAGKP